MNHVSNEQLEKLMTALLGRILDNQKFAEAKNAGLIVLNSAWLVAGVNLINSGKEFSHNFAVAISIALPLVVISLLLAISTLLPRLNFDRLTKSQDPGEECLIYFRHIADIPTTDYSDRLRARYRSSDGNDVTDDFINDMAGQIRANSVITARKFTCFNIGALISALACMILCAPGFIWLLKQQCHYCL